MKANMSPAVALLAFGPVTIACRGVSNHGSLHLFNLQGRPQLAGLQLRSPRERRLASYGKQVPQRHQVQQRIDGNHENRHDR